MENERRHTETIMKLQADAAKERQNFAAQLQKIKDEKGEAEKAETAKKAKDLEIELKKKDDLIAAQKKIIEDIQNKPRLK
jgi:hypothetical protein